MGTSRYDNSKMKRHSLSVQRYFDRFEFPGGIELYPMGHLDNFVTQRSVGGRQKGGIKTKSGAIISFESKLEKKEIQRLQFILEATTIKSQVVELITPSGKKFYPDLIAQLGDGTIVIVEVKHVLDFLWTDVIEKYQTLLAYCKHHHYGCALVDGKWRDFRFVQQGGTIHFPKLMEWFDTTLEKQGKITMKDLRANYPDEKYWPTFVSYALLNGYQTKVSFRHPDWAIFFKR